MKSTNFITIFQSPKSQTFKSCLRDFSNKDRFSFTQSDELIFPTGTIPSDKQKPKERSNCLHAPSSDFLLYPLLWKEVCWSRHAENVDRIFAFDPTFSFQTFSSKRVTRGLNPTFCLDANLCPILFPFLL